MIDKDILSKSQSFQIRLEPVDPKPASWAYISLGKSYGPSSDFDSDDGSHQVKVEKYVNDGKFFNFGPIQSRNFGLSFIPSSAKTYLSHKKDELTINRAMFRMFKGSKIPLMVSSKINLKGECSSGV
ncbi:uncharacterized protein L201_007830 [Kwoniella dendrophila CBS 6074]|uniref:NADH:ubiquinone oxidoreductase intermediate-associated protein 30 domain-containing protein n=1 Tax=Kwoniella dendrophila CBS 6074 TaxID=1295534 RepID=A0AAX4K6W3_9TREE